MRLLHLAIPAVVLLAAVLSPTRAMATPSLVVSVPDQTLALVDGGLVKERFPVSTSRFGLGDSTGSYATPLGSLEIASKIGANAPLGAVFKSRKMTGEILSPNAKGRDPIVTRIIWLRGKEARNANAFGRDIYIHGTPEERNIGRPASYGCIRMRSIDIINLYSQVGAGAEVSIINPSLASVIPELGAKATQMAESNHALGVIR